ncbi:hypothetical protein NJ8700_02980 [Aggregatibacter aphrophilus NJ8700]|uniref:Bacterial membrane protein YfhO n=3 Tax=Aggregatibacter aphrophilus TaxID=732 RepID=A0A448FA00_AGGAP|nr:hypothetical protein [Aggregatibacter aphrophilus]AKS64401.1 hypothetical protein NJ8700_02980 [Aggregatibacter aphrophilus NJ8700]KNE85989.1 hypothetical protein ATCC33389_0201195 [Aggregatibacter aphrophilus ATCC 33389]OBY55178.1 hypothetical protein BBB51_00205 [Aggregatibacter aphrophilus]SQI99161.1 Uncharacterised protein [Aggregatibacter aphrophilus]VEF43381.1 Uncharacterised protein [Aggregatibacter aphrophilus ATCC 33389]
MKNNLISFCVSILISLSILCICVLFDKSFFFVDDAQNEFLPFMREIGQIWLSGEIPFILKDTLIGSNTLIDIHRAIFLPQNILLSIISSRVDKMLLIANISVLINMTIISFSSIKLVNVLKVDKYYGYIMAILFNISPVFLYFYLPSWWNAASGHAWFIASFVTLLFLRDRFSSFNLFLNAISVISLMLSGWPHAIVAYALLCLVYVLEKLYLKNYYLVLKFILFYVGIICAVSPNYSEYLVSLDLIDRSSVFGNFNNFLSITFNQLIMSFTPVYYGFMNTFGGYRLTMIPFGYSSIYILFLLCFVNWKEVLEDKLQIFLGVSILLLFILSQTPSAFGPLRWPLRFVPFLSIAIIIFSILGVNKRLILDKKRILIFLITLLISSILSFFNQEGDFLKILIVQLVFLMFSFLYVFLLKINYNSNCFLGPIYCYICLILMLFVQPSVVGFMSTPLIKDSINMENNYSKGGYILSLTNGRHPKDHIEDLHSAHYLAYGLKAINGASPVGNKELSKLLDTRQSQAFFNVENTINKLSVKHGDNCFYDYLNIDVLVINRVDLNNSIRSSLNDCGFVHKSVRNQFVDYFIRNDASSDAGISFSNDHGNLGKVIKNLYNQEEYIINVVGPVDIIFSRAYWHGYKVYINNIEVPITNEHGLVSVNLSKSLEEDSILKIKYFPMSWKYSLWLSFLGLIILIFIIIKLGNLNDSYSK